MDEFLHELTIPEMAFPKLLEKHSEEIKSNPDSEILYYKQTHEIYMYEFFKYCKLDCFSRIEVNKVSGVAVSPIRLQSLITYAPANENQFFSSLLNAPVPFVFIPECNIGNLENFCIGASHFKEANNEGILMDLRFASNVGMEFLAADILLESNVYFLYIGLIYPRQ
ncbi:hypothetical protein GINT2_000840 [Glugoides intestinalis]